MPKISLSTGRWPSGRERIYVMENRYWNCLVSGGVRTGGVLFPAGEFRLADSGNIRCNDSRESE
jgi:hypothetical protein